MADLAKSIAETIGRGVAALKLEYQKGIVPANTVSMNDLIEKEKTLVRFKGKLYRVVVTEIGE